MAATYRPAVPQMVLYVIAKGGRYLIGGCLGLSILWIAFCIGSNSAIVDAETEREKWEVGPVVTFAIVLLLQFLFVLPLKITLQRSASGSRPMWLSIIAGAGAMGVITIGLLATLWELFVRRGRLEWDGQVFILLMAATWMIWGVVFYYTWRAQQQRHQNLFRITRYLLGGTLLDGLIAWPTYAYVHDPDHCECARGSYVGLIIAFIALFYVFGPGVILLCVYRLERWKSIMDSSARSTP